MCFILHYTFRFHFSATIVNFISPHGSKTDIKQEKTDRETCTQLNKKMKKNKLRQNTQFKHTHIIIKVLFLNTPDGT